MASFQVQDLRFIPKSQAPPSLRPRNLFYCSNPSLFPQIPPPHPPSSPWKPSPSPQISSSLRKSNAHCPNHHRIQFPAQVVPLFCTITGSGRPNSVDSHFFEGNSVDNRVSAKKISPLREILTQHELVSLKTQSSLRISVPPCLDTVSFQVLAQKIASNPCGCLASLAALSLSLPADAAEAEQVSQKINIEKILLAIDDFFNRNPFFVAGVTFIWLVVIPLTQEYLKKYKQISAIDAFRKLQDVQEAQLLDIRKRQSVKYMSSPNLKILNKNVVQVEFAEGNEEGFAKEVLKNFGDPGSTILCILDNFEGDSLKVAELLYNKGFKEAYAIKGGLRGKDGWQAIQKKYLPPAVHVYPRKEKGSTTKSKIDAEKIDKQGKDDALLLATHINHQETMLNSDNGEASPTKIASEVRVTPERPLSPYPNYPDFKPPSSPTPSKPQMKHQKQSHTLIMP